MYKFERYRQLGLADFNQPAGLKMDSENRWVRKVATIPWKAIEEKYAELFPSDTGMPAKPMRTAIEIPDDLEPVWILRQGTVGTDQGKSVLSVLYRTARLLEPSAADNADRVEVERSFSLAKRCYGLRRIVTRLDTTTRSSIALSILIMNVARIAARSLCRLLVTLFSKFFGQDFLLFYEQKYSGDLLVA